MSEGLTLADLAGKPLWVAWQTEDRPDGKPTKVPYAPDGRKAMADKPATWGTRPAAEARARRLPKPYGAGGVGIELSSLGDGRNLAGVDLDSCRTATGSMMEGWAEDVLASFDSYAEVSPSSTGVKLFFTFDTEAMSSLRPHLGNAKFGKQFKRGGGDHPPAIELHLGNRYFAVTDALLHGSRPDLRQVGPEIIIRLLRETGPAFVGLAAKGAAEKRERQASTDGSRSAKAFRIGGKARRDGATFEEMCAALREHPDTADWYAEKGEPNGGRELRNIWEKTDPATSALFLSRGKPLDSARRYLLREHTLGGVRTMLHQNATFYTWRASHYVERAPEEVRASLYAFLDGAKTITDEGEVIDFDPTKNRVANVLEALAAEAQLSRLIRPPAWLGGGSYPAASEVIACRNALLHLPTGKTRPHTPHFWTLNALPFDYQPTAPEPVHWLTFLASVWPGDQQSIDTLQELFGLCLTGDTRFQKAFLVVGPKRSGKGTIARVLTQLLGAENVGGPTLSGLSTNFGLAPLIGKRVAIISDARLSGKADQAVIAERLLSITGEDAITIDRKFREAWTGKLDVRFVILTNELPRLTDSSGALASRFIILRMVQSFYGQEDLALGSKLTPELPGILLWAIAGWKRLEARGHFIPPASSTAAQQELEDLGSPIGAFIRDRCIVEQGQAVNCDMLYRVWCTWCEEQGRDHSGTKQTFGRDLAAAVPGLKRTQPRQSDGSRTAEYEGIGFLPVEQVARTGTRATALYGQLSDEPPLHTSYPYT